MSAFGQWQSAALAAGTAYVDRSVDSATGQFTSITLQNLLFSLHDQTYQYNARGNLASTSTTVSGLIPSSNTETFVYDDNHRLIGSARSNGPAISYAYDAAGNLTAKDDYGSAYYYNHNKPNAVSSVDLIGGGSVSFGYDANGNRTHENGSQTLWYKRL